MKEQRGHRASLNSLAGPTLQEHKSGDGLEAINLFNEGRMEELKKYCLDDVRLTKEVYDYGCENGKVLFTSNWDYKTYEISVNWKKETEKLLKQTPSEEQSFPSSLF